MDSNRRPSLKLPVVLAVWAVWALVVSAPAAAGEVRYDVLPGDGTSIVFESKAPLEKFHGRTGAVDGWCRFDPDDLTAGVALEIGVDLATFDTGNRKRNGHMRENHLETDRFPRAVFRGGTLEGDVPRALAPGVTTSLVLSGELDLHGVRRALTCTVDLTRSADGFLTVATGFGVKLGDHDIERPKFLIMKLADEQKVEVRLRMEAGS